jgi:hypothetical protein
VRENWLGHIDPFGKLITHAEYLENMKRLIEACYGNGDLNSARSLEITYKAALETGEQECATCKAVRVSAQIQDFMRKR